MHGMHRRIHVVGILWATALGTTLTRPLAAQQSVGTIQGTVKTASGGEPLDGVTVQVDGQSRTVITDANGAFRISGVPAGQRTLTVKRLGHHPESRVVGVAAGKVTQAHFSLTQAAFLLSDV